MKEEVKKILKMIEEKKITAEEGEKLIDALDSDSTAAAVIENNIPLPEPKFLRVHVVDNGEGKDEKVDINIPISLVEIGLKIGTKIGPKFAPEAEALKDIDYKEIIEAIRLGARGKIVDVKSSTQVVEIYVD